MADNLTAKYADLDTNSIGPIRFVDIGGVFYAVSIIAQSDGTLLDTIPVSAASLPLPSGASTAAKQPALGTAGTASADVITVQGIASMTALKVDGSAVTQPVSGTFWQATQPVSVASVPSHDVTNAGTFAVQAAQSGTWNVTNVSGTVSLPTGASTLAEQQSQTTLLGTMDADTGAIATNTTDLPNVIGTDGAAGPSKAISVAGTESGGTLQEIRVDADGHLQIDVLTAPTTTVTGTVDLGATDNAVLDTIASPVSTIGTTPLQRVAIFDASDAQITSFGGGTEYTEDAAAAANPVGKATILVRADTPGAVATTDGDNVAQRGTNYGAAYVQVVDSSGNFIDSFGGAGGTSSADDADFTAGTTLGTIVQGVYESTPTSVTDGDVGAVGITSDRRLKTSAVVTSMPTTTVTATNLDIRDLTNADVVTAELSATDNAVLDAIAASVAGTLTVGSHAVTNAGTFAVQVDNTVAVSAAGLTAISGAVHAEDVASADGEKGIPAMAIRKATPANTSDTDGDYEMLQMSAGRLWTSATIDAALPAGTNAIGKLASNTGVTIGAVEIAAAQTLATVTTCSTVTTLTGGGVAHDGADSGNPIKIGARAAATLSDDTMVANADRTDAVSDLDGAIIVRNQFPLADLLSERVSNTDGSSTAFSTFGATASTRSYVTALSIYNASATAGYVDFRDGTGGSVLYTVPIPAGAGVVLSGGGLPLFRTTANTALAYDVSAALTTVYISISGFKSKASG